MTATRPRGSEREALYVRIPTDRARDLDRASFELKLSKQDLVSALLERYVDPSSAASLESLRALHGPLDADGNRITIEPAPQGLTLGRHDFRPDPVADVLTLADAAELLQVEETSVASLAERGELPGRKIGEEWRFTRQAILDWLSAGNG
ncbi:helix-turn-helix domain-containing protein [Conexibacter arvalis]|uniref:Excisionase family DNA binding protein n=1 Tax=Conexibacter arvalis TaxID=912552 RepID=A0A840IEX1_9ACTN|nr:helix-turn-helix domain-containing protein [Conexibacter arvalis]MBB4663392.1 excisionase family DNA binding protein [Conexibacter arvalis]